MRVLEVGAEHELREDDISYSTRILLGTEYTVSVQTTPPLEDIVIYMNVTDVCKIDSGFSRRVYMHVTNKCKKTGKYVCKKINSNDPDYRPDFTNDIVEELREESPSTGIYKGSYKILHNTEGYIKLRRYCYPNIYFTGPSIKTELVDNIPENWNYAEICGETDRASVV